jgi:hypothetical protein
MCPPRRKMVFLRDKVQNLRDMSKISLGVVSGTIYVSLSFGSPGSLLHYVQDKTAVFSPVNSVNLHLDVRNQCGSFFRFDPWSSFWNLAVGC